MSELLTDRIGQENVILSEPVTVIDQSDESSIQITSESGQKYRCKYVINASPLHCAGKWFCFFCIQIDIFSFDLVSVIIETVTQVTKLS